MDEIEITMPKYLKVFLEALTDQQADELWLYFDGCDNSGIIELIVDSHPVVKAQNEAECANWLVMLGLGGVFSWTSKRHAQPLIPILEDFEWLGRKVYICFDSDFSQKPLVQLAASRLALMLTSRGAIVHEIMLQQHALSLTTRRKK